VKNNAMLVVSVGGKIIREKKLIHVQPSEMIDCLLTIEDMSGINPRNAIMEISIL
jgi:hypothetical protein